MTPRGRGVKIGCAGSVQVSPALLSPACEAVHPGQHSYCHRGVMTEHGARVKVDHGFLKMSVGLISFWFECLLSVQF